MHKPWCVLPIATMGIVKHRISAGAEWSNWKLGQSFSICPGAAPFHGLLRSVSTTPRTSEFLANFSFRKVQNDKKVCLTLAFPKEHRRRCGLGRLCHIRALPGAASRYDLVGPPSPYKSRIPWPGFGETASTPGSSGALRQAYREESKTSESYPAHSSSTPCCDAIGLACRRRTACRTFEPFHKHCP